MSYFIRENPLSHLSKTSMPLHADLGLSSTGRFTVYAVGGSKPSIAPTASGSSKSKAAVDEKAPQKSKKEAKKKDSKKKEEIKAPVSVELTPELQAK